MRAAPALRIDVERFGVSRTVLGVLVLASGAALVAWQWPGRDSNSLLRTALVSASWLTIGAASWRLRASAFRLRWDGESWHVGPLAKAQAEPWSGRLGVAVDLGAWMLLRFAPASGPRHCPYRWLAVQRGGLEAQWHALRGAVYSARSDRPLHLSASSSARPDATE